MLKFLTDERGMESVEWAVVAALIVIGLTAAFLSLGQAVQNKVQALTGEISSGGPSPQPSP